MTSGGIASSESESEAGAAGFLGGMVAEEDGGREEDKAGKNDERAGRGRWGGGGARRPSRAPLGHLSVPSSPKVLADLVAV